MDRPICQTCKKNLVAKLNSGNWGKKCDSCKRTPVARKNRSVKSVVRRKAGGVPDYVRPSKPKRGAVCARCGFVPEHSCQLDIDHIDGNHFNNDLSNLQTLCANCHRLKTLLNKDYRGYQRI